MSRGDLTAGEALQVEVGPDGVVLTVQTESGVVEVTMQMESAFWLARRLEAAAHAAWDDEFWRKH